MDLSIIIVNYNSKDKLSNCLHSIANSDLAGINWETVVVDNHSGDQLSDLVRVFPNTKLVSSETNLGMGGGNNLGIKNSVGRFILISNPDIIFQSAAIKLLLRYLKEHPEIGLLGPKLLNPDSSLQYSCARFPKIYLPFLRRTALGNLFPEFLNKYLMKSDGHQAIKAVDWLLGACFLVRRDEFFIGPDKLFDERFFMYFEDVDLCRRIKFVGKQVVYYPPAIAIHDHVRASARQPWYLALLTSRLARIHLQSWWRYFRKWKFN